MNESKKLNWILGFVIRPGLLATVLLFLPMPFPAYLNWMFFTLFGVGIIVHLLVRNKVVNVVVDIVGGVGLSAVPVAMIDNLNDLFITIIAFVVYSTVGFLVMNMCSKKTDC